MFAEESNDFKPSCEHGPTNKLERIPKDELQPSRYALDVAELARTIRKLRLVARRVRIVRGKRESQNAVLIKVLIVQYIESFNAELEFMVLIPGHVK